MRAATGAGRGLTGHRGGPYSLWFTPMTREIPKAYEPQEIEQRWSEQWFAQKLYYAGPAGPADSRPVFSIAIPPPNVTGSIHIGHMLEHTQIDILVRWRRMRGFRTLWLPGSDHAGIATQVVVERELAKEGLKRTELGREEFERRVWEWKAQSGGTIKKQMIRLGVSCDWSRERFTLDPPMYRAVLEAFLRLYREGLIYRGRYIVNWCPRCMTALSDLETVHEERPGHLWYIRYPAKDGKDSIVVATTRPETMLGDTAVAVHPDDARYGHLVGKTLILPLMNREIAVVADAAVDPEFGTGAVKVTPAHDPNDFEIGRRHHLPEVDVMTAEARMSPAAGDYAGLDRLAARKEVVEALKAQGLLEKITDITHAVGLCQRCKTVVEPRLSTQWFCKMKPLAEPAMAAVRDGLIAVVPENQRKILLGWLENIRDWCISRQLWWGHRIPVWHCACGAMIPARDSRVEIVNGRAQAASPPQTCTQCGRSELTQDPDVLDTWFSSGLWPFSTLGWPDDTEDLRTFYPNSLLISGYDILFFWDARMIMMGLKLVPRAIPDERIPFRQLYLHAIVRDPHGVKMSKTRGNVVDPLEVIEKYGTDALRFTLAIMAAPGTDIALSEERILSYRAFANKIWNAVRFLFVNLEKAEAAGIRFEDVAGPEVRRRTPRSEGGLDLAERWIFSRLAATIEQTNRALAEFRFHEAAHGVYHFFWGDVCDWYLEWMKPRLAAACREDALATWRNLFTIMEAALRLLHPFMPFLTEELWTRLPQQAPAEGAPSSISLQPFPQAAPDWLDPEAEQQMNQLQEIIVAARNIRAEMKLDPKRKVAAELAPAAGFPRSMLERHSDALLRLANLSALRLADGGRRLDPSKGLVRTTAEFELLIPFEQAVDQAAEVAKLRKEIDRLEKDIQSKTARLGDADFRGKAPADVVNAMERTVSDRRTELEKLRARLRQLEA